MGHSRVHGAQQAAHPGWEGASLHLVMVVQVDPTRVQPEGQATRYDPLDAAFERQYIQVGCTIHHTHAWGAQCATWLCG